MHVHFQEYAPAPFMPIGAQCATHHCLSCRITGRLAGHRELFRPLSILLREISAQTIFEVTLSPCRLEILLSLCSVTAVQTSFPVQQFKRTATSSRNYPTGIVLLEARRQVVGQSDIQLFIGP